MEKLPHRHLTRLALDVDFANIVAVGEQAPRGPVFDLVEAGR